MALSSLLLVKKIKLPGTNTLPKSKKINKTNNRILRNDFLFNPIKWDGARIMKSHPNRATTVNLWSSETLKNFPESVQEWKGFNDSLYSFAKVYKTAVLVISLFAWIIKDVKGRGGGKIGGKGGADGQETGDKGGADGQETGGEGGTDGNAAGSKVHSNDAAAKGGAGRGRGEAAAGGGQAAAGGGQAAGGGGLRVEFEFAFSLLARH